MKNDMFFVYESSNMTTFIFSATSSWDWLSLRRDQLRYDCNFLQHFCIFLRLMCIFYNSPPSFLRTHVRNFRLYKRSYQQEVEQTLLPTGPHEGCVWAAWGLRSAALLRRCCCVAAALLLCGDSVGAALQQHRGGVGVVWTWRLREGGVGAAW